MAFLREYKFIESSSTEWTLIEFFYQDSYDRVPSIIFRLSMPEKYLVVDTKKRSVTSLMIFDEVRRLLNLIEQPYWKSYVRTLSPDHRYFQDGLFDS